MHHGAGIGAVVAAGGRGTTGIERAGRGRDVAANLDVQEELVLRRSRLAHLAQAKKILELRVAEQYQVEQAEYEAQVQAREA